MFFVCVKKKTVRLISIIEGTDIYTVCL